MLSAESVLRLVYGARLAAVLGWGFAFAFHFSPDAAVPAMRSYREGFRPSEHPKGSNLPLPSPEEALAYPYSAADLQQVRNSRRMLVAGTPDRVRERLDELATQLGADELMVTSHIHGHEERLHSYQLLADVYGLGRSSTGEIHVPLG